MQTEIEKYDLINQYLKGKLSERDRIQFETSINLDAQLHAEVEMHKMLNNAIVDHYLLDVKHKTQNVIQDRKLQKTKLNRVIGLGSIALVSGILATYYLSNEPIYVQKINNNKEVFTTKPNQTKLKQTITNNEKELKKSLSTILEPTKPNYITKEISTGKLIGPSVLPTDVPTSQTNLKPTPESTEILTNNPEFVNQKKESVKETTSESNEIYGEPQKPQDIQLILNVSRNEPVTFPVEESFMGILEVLNENGTQVCQLNIINGQPNTWDGLSTHGGQVTSGQYVFFMKNREGKIEKQGFITVVR